MNHGRKYCLMRDTPEQPLVIRGFCARYRELSVAALTYEDDRPGYFDHGSHEAMLESGLDVVLQYGGHDSRAVRLVSTTNAALQLFESRYGLHFEATIFASEFPKVREFSDKLDWIGVSCDALDGHEVEEDVFEGRSCWKVKQAWFSHIALVESPLQPNCRAWRADKSIPATHAIIRGLNAEWLQGQEEARRAKQRRPTPAAPATSLRSGMSAPRLAVNYQNMPEAARAAFRAAFSRMR